MTARSVFAIAKRRAGFGRSVSAENFGSVKFFYFQSGFRPRHILVSQRLAYANYFIYGRRVNVFSQTFQIFGEFYKIRRNADKNAGTQKSNVIFLRLKR
jgi:hypothetical protein